jgi:predicted Zn-dependent peptidase
MTARLIAERPVGGEPRPYRFPEVSRRQRAFGAVTAGGNVLAAHLPGRALAAVSLVVDAGAAAEPPEQAGLSVLTARALGEGTEDRGAYEFAVAAERLGADFHAHADWDSLRTGFSAPVARVTDAAALLAEAVRRPGFADDDVERVHSDRLDELRLDWAQPGPRAAAAFADALFTGRYAVLSGGRIDSVAALSADDVRRFHRERFGPETATLVVAGDLDRIDVDAIGETVFGGWTAGAQAPAPPVFAERGGSRRVVLVDRPGSVQSMLVVGHSGPARSAPDYVPATTAAMALGGLFGSRLSLKLREQMGYTYGVSATFEMRRRAGTFGVRSAVKGDTTAPALADTLAGIEAAHADGFAEAEVQAARDFRAGVFPIQFETPMAVASGLGDLVVHGLPDDYFDTVRAEMATVPLAAVNAASAERLRPDELVSIVVGDAAAVAGQLEQVGAGPVEIVRDSG